jgi:hypothetical protein
MKKRLLYLVAVFAIRLAVAADSCHVVDHRYSTSYWYSMLNRPDDWHKQLADDRGSLLYDFGPGPYVKPQTVVSISLQGDSLIRASQTLDSPRVPILHTLLQGKKTTIDITTASLWPASSAESRSRYDGFMRLDGISGAMGWPVPDRICDPAFRSVAWGTNRPLRYRIAVAPGSCHQVVLGFCETYRKKERPRVLNMHVEGATVRHEELFVASAQGKPQVFRFDGCDCDKDGWLSVEIHSQPGADVNLTLNGIWLYPPNVSLSEEQMIMG